MNAVAVSAANLLREGGTAREAVSALEADLPFRAFVVLTAPDGGRHGAVAIVRDAAVFQVYMYTTLRGQQRWRQARFHDSYPTLSSAALWALRLLSARTQRVHAVVASGDGYRATQLVAAPAAMRIAVTEFAARDMAP